MDIKYSQVIYYTTFEIGWESNWEILMHMGRPFTTMESAIKYVRHNYKFGGAVYIGLAPFDQMEIGNASWDNM